jgi:hypothetical protein
MHALRVRIGEFWCRVLDQDEYRVLIRDPIHYCLPRDSRPRRPPRVWVYRHECREITHGISAEQAVVPVPDLFGEADDAVGLDALGRFFAGLQHGCR